MSLEFFARTDITAENCPPMGVRAVAAALANAGIEDAAYEARCLFLRFGNPSSMILFGDEVSRSPELYYAVQRRLRREPLCYVLGDAEFYREKYITTPAVLIPRQDTEILVDYAVKNLPCGARFLDICTGSGCVAISVLKNTDATSALAVDISPEAIEVAEKNRELNLGRDSTRLTLAVADALEMECGERFDAILSNPPYIAEEVYRGLEAEIFYEPKIAFVGGGDDGADFYRALTAKYKNNLADGGFIAYEIGYDQAGSLRDIAEKNGFTCEIIKDYSSNDRVAVLRKK